MGLLNDYLAHLPTVKAAPWLLKIQRKGTSPSTRLI
jgi:hypothetical protein